MCGKRNCYCAIWSEDYDWDAEPSVIDVVEQEEPEEIEEAEERPNFWDNASLARYERRQVWLREYEESKECASTSQDTAFSWYSRAHRSEEEHHVEDESRLEGMWCIQFRPSAPVIKEANRVTRRLYKRSHILQKLGEKMIESYLRQRPSPAVEKVHEELIKLIEKQLQDNYPGCSIQPYGGSHNGFGTRCSDLDITIITPEMIIAALDDEDEGYNPKIQVKIANIVEILESKENRLATGLNSLENLELKNIPLAKMEFEKSGHKIEVDFTSGNINGVKNTKLLKVYSRIDERAVQLMTIIKKWAKKNNLHGGPLYRFNTYSLVCLVINFLQKGVSPPVLPVLHKIVPSLNTRLYDHSVEEIEALFKWEQRSADVSITELLIGFFAYYAQFNFSEWSVDLTRAPLCNRNLVSYDWYHNEATRLSVDCSVRARSPTRKLSEECYVNFRNTLNTMNKVIWQELAEGIEDDKTMEKLFELLDL